MQKNAGWAKYLYFSRFSSLGFLFLCLGLGLGVPTDSVQARAFSYLGGSSAKAVSTPSEPNAQNSQTIDFLEGAINFDPNPAKGGGDVTIVDNSALLSEVGPTGTIADIEATEHQGKVSLYVVNNGDTLEKVAKMFGITVSTIRFANDLPSGASLRVGQNLVILPIDGIQHTVEKGDTLGSIAKKYSGDIDEILDFNDLTAGKKLTIGDIIVIPNGKEAVTSTSAINATSRAKSFSSLPVYSGYYTHPVPLGHKTQGIHGYNGVDYGAPMGTPIYAAAEGVVVVSNFRTSYCGRSCGGGYGNYVVIEHPNGTQTLYGHMSTVYAPVGARVDKGQWIGEVGNTGRSTGPHLHFEVRGGRNPF